MAAVLSMLFFGCENDSLQRTVSPTEVLADSAFDSHSYSNIREVRTKHLHLDLDVNFTNQTLYGVARHEVQNNGSDTAIFDMKGLVIQKVTLGRGNEKETSFMIGQWDKDSLLGQPLLVKISKQTKHINIYYETTETTEAIDWLKPEQTSGRKFPFMYTQGQAILTRSWIPLQDSPNNRITYSANIKVPKDLMAVMSAGNVQSKKSDGMYAFKMEQPIPCYLIALAVGDLRFRKLNNMCGVYAEPEMIGKAAYEFYDLPKMIDAAEKLYGSYRWERYDVLVLPPAFPFGGMENPRLTFLSPSVIAGDRSLVSVVAHELAHSWSGNLVTNASWEDFWLNEGFTVYFEQRIMEELYGKEVADMLAQTEFQELKEELTEIKKGKYPEDGRLKLDLLGRNPDDAMTDVAYVKGAFFLKTLENKVGRDKFDVFLRSYFENNAFTTISTESFKKYLTIHLLDLHDLRFNVDEWLYKSDIPSTCIRIYSKRLGDIHKLARRFGSGEDIFKRKIRWVKVKGRKRKKKEILQLKRSDYVAIEWVAFLKHLPKKMNTKSLERLDQHLHFSGWGNAEVATEWYQLAIRSGYKQAYPNIERFLKKMGRRRFLLPIYRELAKTKENKEWAQRIFETAKLNYHYVSSSSIEKILK
jgi:leukotriene-A4 hydrolase